MAGTGAKAPDHAPNWVDDCAIDRLGHYLLHRFFLLFLIRMNGGMAVWPLLRLLLIFNLMLGGGVGLCASAIQLGLGRAQIDRKGRWMALETLSWLVTALLWGIVLTFFMQITYSDLTWALTLLIGVPPIWVMQAVVTDWALEPQANAVSIYDHGQVDRDL